jgi:hypothetical protein
MAGWRLLLPALAVAATADRAVARLLPSFAPDPCAWEATHVVVVTEGTKIDGVVEVLESWKGDLKKGDTLTVSELAAFAAEAERVVAKPLFRDPPPGPARVSGSRMVLFLIKKPAKNGGDKAGPPPWGPAAGEWGGIKVSVAWVEDGKVFAFAQQINPGPCELVQYGFTECEFRCRVDVFLEAQAALTKAVRRADPAALAEAVPPLLRSESWYVKGAVIRALGAAGKLSLPALRGVLRDAEAAQWHDNAIRALAKAGGADVGPELVKLVETETEFWKRHGPGLPKGWWNGAGGAVKWEEVGRLRARYGTAHAAVEALKETRFAEGRASVTGLRDVWRSIPQLSEIDQMTKASDDALSVLK